MEHRTARHIATALRLDLRKDLKHAAGFNAKLALSITRVVGTIWAFYVFNGIALVSLPAAISSGQLTVLINWVSSNWIQLILLPALMVGQNLQNAAADARADRTFNDVELILDRLDTRTQGGLKEVLEAVQGAPGPRAISSDSTSSAY